MDNPSFNRYFDVFTEDQILARYALSPKLMERFCGLKEKSVKALGAQNFQGIFI